MLPISPTTVPPPKPNQQLINALLDAPAHDHFERRRDHAHALGARLRAALAGRTLPLLAVQTTYSLLRGTGHPTLWGDALAALHGHPLPPGKDRRGANRPSGLAAGGAVDVAIKALAEARKISAVQPATPAAEQPTSASPPAPETPWAVAADRDDLLGLPTCIDRWGRGRVAVGATLALGDHEALVLAPDEPAYARLCRLLSWRHEDPDGWRRWQEGGPAPLDLDGQLWLVTDAAWGARLRELGAEVWWRAGLRPQQRPVPFPIATAVIVSHLDDAQRRSAPVLAAIRERGTVAAKPCFDGICALTDLAAMPAAYSGYEEQLERGAELLARCRYVPGGIDDRGRPVLHLPPTRVTDPDARLRAEAERGLAWRYAKHSPADQAAAHERLEHELAIIADKRFAGYILLVWDLAKDRRTCGRGSAASSIVCYCLAMTNVDPIRYRLVFERFLAPERTDPPDIDIDFAWDERNDILAMTLQRHGADHVAMVATHQTMHRWAALREAARAHGLPDSEIDAVRQRLHDADAYGTPADIVEPWPAILAAADAISGAPRHLGLHCGGAVITARAIRDLVPVHPAAKTLEVDGPGGKRSVHVPTIAWEKDGAEDLGFAKIDLLGNRSLAVVRDCLKDLAADGITLTEGGWDAINDPQTKRIMAAGLTLGCFYIESPSMRQLQAKVGSPDFDRLVVHSSIIRPAANNVIRTYIQRYHLWEASGRNPTAEQRAEWYPHPCLANLLSESFGVLSYQEDVMEVSKALAGFGSGESNQLRKALGRSDVAERLRALAGRFHQGAKANGVSDSVIDHVWGMIASFAGYSFCKAHSASYAMVSFQCAYLKAHHPAHFMARVIANQGGYYHTAAYVEEARRLGVEIRGPCALRSQWLTVREGSDAIRIGFQLVKGLSKTTAEAIVAARESAPRNAASRVGESRTPYAVRKAPFLGLHDFKIRCRVASDELTALCDAGALDALLPGCNTAQRCWLVAVVARDREAFIHPPTAGGQEVIDLVSEDTADPAPPVLRDLPIDQVRRRRFACLGFLPELHPLCLWKLPVKRQTRCRDITAKLAGRRVSVIAWPIARKNVSATYRSDEDGAPLPTPRFEAMCFVTLEDETGLVETVWFPESYRAYGVLLERGEPLRLSGTVEVDFDFPTLTVERVDTIPPPADDQRGDRPTAHPALELRW